MEDSFMENTCSTCRYNEDGLCDRVGILVDDDDQCGKWETVKSRLSDLRS